MLTVFLCCCHLKRCTSQSFVITLIWVLFLLPVLWINKSCSCSQQFTIFVNYSEPESSCIVQKYVFSDLIISGYDSFLTYTSLKIIIEETVMKITGNWQCLTSLATWISRCEWFPRCFRMCILPHHLHFFLSSSGKCIHLETNLEPMVFN